MASIHSYLNFNGNTEEAFNFYKSVFGGEFATLQRFGDVPGCEGMTETEMNGIMHVALPVGGTMLMGTDVGSNMPPATFGTAVSLSINAESEAEARQIFEGLSAGGKLIMALENTFWGALFGMVNDKFGIQWMVNYDYPKS